MAREGKVARAESRNPNKPILGDGSASNDGQPSQWGCQASRSLPTCGAVRGGGARSGANSTSARRTRPPASASRYDGAQYNGNSS